MKKADDIPTIFIGEDGKLVLKGKVMFSNITEARGFKDSDENKNFSITIKVGSEDSENVMAIIDSMEAKAYDKATEGLTAIQKRGIQKAPPKYRDVTDVARGESTGEVKFEFKRKEILGPPRVFNTEGALEKGKKFIGRDSDVIVRVVIIPYKAGAVRGVSYKLEDIRILNEVRNPGKAAVSGKSDTDAFFMTVNEDDLPF